jgi:hypothetical protein
MNGTNLNFISMIFFLSVLGACRTVHSLSLLFIDGIMTFYSCAIRKKALAAYCQGGILSEKKRRIKN